MQATVYLNTGKKIDLDQVAAESLLKEVKAGNITSSLSILHIVGSTHRLDYTIPISSISYIDYWGEADA